MVAAAVAGAAIAGGVAKGAIGAGAAGSSAKALQGGLTTAANIEQKFYESQPQNFQPYISAGTSILPQMAAYPGQTDTDLQKALGYQAGLMPQIPTEQDVSNMPGYSFLLNQGLKATQNSAASRGLGVSGAAFKGAANYAENTADTFWKDLFGARQQQFVDAGSLFTNTYNARNLGYNQLATLGQLGEKSAADLGNIGQKVYSNIGQDAVGYGQAGAAGITKQAEAENNAITSISNAPLSYFGAQNYFGPTVTGQAATPDQIARAGW